jgi:predicted phosphohydrolase
MTLADAARKANGKRVVCMMHYPPLLDLYRETGFTEILERCGVQDLLYGHLHGAGIRTAFRGEQHGVRYHLVSCDGLGFRMYQLPD